MQLVRSGRLKALAVTASSRFDGAPEVPTSQEAGMPGRILRVKEEGFDVRLNGGVLRVLRVQPKGGKKMPATEWAREMGLEVGARLG